METQKILIVDDKKDNLYTLKKVLKNLDVEVIKAESGNDALIAILNHDFTLAILDVQMPEMDGYELAEFIRSEEKTKYLPIIFLSAVFSDDFHVFKGYQSGAVDFITKPFNPEILLNKVNVFLQLNKQKQTVKKQADELQVLVHELNEKQEKLKELNATKDKFFSIVAHDLKNPFNTIIGFSELLLTRYENLDDERIIHFHQLIHEAAKRSYSLLENLLEWSRSQTGRLKWQPMKFDVKDIIQETVGLLNSNATKKSIQLNQDIKPGSLVYADMNMITTVIRNIISNAVKFTPINGRITITVDSFNDNFIIISIKDTGVGIAQDDLPKLFKIEENYSTEGTAEEKGTGLGLILCKEFIEKNEGKIWVESELEKGSIFYFTLKKADAEA